MGARLEASIPVAKGAEGSQPAFCLPHKHSKFGARFCLLLDVCGGP